MQVVLLLACCCFIQAQVTPYVFVDENEVVDASYGESFFASIAVRGFYVLPAFVVTWNYCMKVTGPITVQGTLSMNACLNSTGVLTIVYGGALNVNSGAILYGATVNVNGQLTNNINAGVIICGSLVIGSTAYMYVGATTTVFGSITNNNYNNFGFTGIDVIKVQLYGTYAGFSSLYVVINNAVGTCGVPGAPTPAPSQAPIAVTGTTVYTTTTSAPMAASDTTESNVLSDLEIGLVCIVVVAVIITAVVIVRKQTPAMFHKLAPMPDYWTF